MAENITAFVGLDIGDSKCDVVMVDKEGETQAVLAFKTDEEVLRHEFGGRPRMRVVLEAGTHSHWVGDVLTELGHEVRVLNPRDLAVIWNSYKKTDQRDASVMAELSRTDSKLAKPIVPRSKQTREGLVLLRSRAVLVDSRTKMINSARGMLKSFGVRLPECGSSTFHRQVSNVPEELLEGLTPVFESIQALSGKIKEMDDQVARLGLEKYPTAALLQTVCGVGPVVSLAFLLVIENPYRFKQKRDVAAYIGLVTKLDRSGSIDKQLGITKCGDPYLRKLLVQAAQHILGRFGKPSALRDWGLKLAARGGQKAKSKAVVAVARKLAVLLLAMWQNGTPFTPYPHGEPVKEGQEQNSSEPVKTEQKPRKRASVRPAGKTTGTAYQLSAAN